MTADATLKRIHPLPSDFVHKILSCGFCDRGERMRVDASEPKTPREIEQWFERHQHCEAQAQRRALAATVRV